MQEVMRPGGNGRPLARPVEDESSKELVRELVEEGKHLLREQIHLMQLEARDAIQEGRQRFDNDLATVKAEIKEEGSKAVRAGGTVGIGGVLTHAALYLVLFAIVAGLGLVMPLWLASLLLAVVVGGVGAFLIKGGIDRIKRVRFVPRRTVQQLQEDKSWMREKSRALRSTIRASA
jgi:hypothetical protein